MGCRRAEGREVLGPAEEAETAQGGGAAEMRGEGHGERDGGGEEEQDDGYVVLGARARGADWEEWVYPEPPAETGAEVGESQRGLFVWE